MFSKIKILSRILATGLLLFNIPIFGTTLVAKHSLITKTTKSKDKIINQVIDPISKYQNQDIFERISKYFKDLPDVIMLFEQTSRDSRADGALLISKKFGLRCNYFAPYPLNMVIYKSNVSVYDYSLESLIKDKIEHNFWDFLITGSLDSKIEVSDIIIDKKSESVTLSKKDVFTVKITFNIEPYKLSTIEIMNENISLILKSIRPITKVNKNLFIMRDPKIFGKLNRYSLKDLEKNFIYDDVSK